MKRHMIRHPTIVTVITLAIIVCAAAPLFGAPDRVQSVQEYFDKDKLAARFDTEAAKDVSHTYRMDIAGPSGGTWSIAIDKGTMKVTEGAVDGVNTVFKTEDATWLKIANGETTHMAEVMKGKLKSTDLSQVQKYFTYFPNATKS